MNKIFFQCASLFLAVAFLAAGCGKGGAGANVQSFDKASPEIKTFWEQGLAADKSNDYYGAATNYNQLVALEAKLTPAQFGAVSAASRTLMQRLTAAADSGDTVAKQALAKLMASQGGR